MKIHNLIKSIKAKVRYYKTLDIIIKGILIHENVFDKFHPIIHQFIIINKKENCIILVDDNKYSIKIYRSKDIEINEIKYVI